jgi:hypothetical protein
VRPGALAALLVGLVARQAAAQLPTNLGLDLGLSRPRFQSASPLGGEQLSGLVAGGRVRLVLKPVSLDMAYSQGRLTADTGSAAARDIVEGSLFLTVRPVPWLALKGGPHLRAYAAPGGTERWVLWEGRAHADMPILDGAWLAYGELWLAVASSVNVSPGADGARGAEAGLTIQLPRSPLWARLAYTVDQAKFKNGARTESVQSVVLAVGFGGR